MIALYINYVSVNYINIELQISLDNFCSSFNAEIDPTVSIEEQDIVHIYIGETQKFFGTIETIDDSDSVEARIIRISGRSITADLVDSSIIQKQYTISNFPKLIEQVLKDNNFTRIKVYNDVDDIDKIKGSCVPTRNDKIYNFLQKYAQLLQVLLITDGDGNIRIVREARSQSFGGLFFLPKLTNGDNIISSQLNHTILNRFNEVIVKSTTKDEYGEKIHQQFKINDNEVRNTRRKIINAKKNVNYQIIKNTGQWQLNARRGKSTSYSCTVDGFFYRENFLEELTWNVNSAVELSDSNRDINGLFLIDSVTYRQSLQGGGVDSRAVTQTDLRIVNIGSYTNILQNKKFNPIKLFGFPIGINDDLSGKYKKTKSPFDYFDNFKL